MTLKLIHRSVLSGLIAGMIVVGCSTAPAPGSAPAPQSSSTESAETKTTPDPRFDLSPQQQEEMSRAAWEAYKQEHPFEERLEKMGVNEDPGMDPSPDTEFYRFGKPYTIHKFEKQYAIFRDSPTGWVRPFQGVSFAGEIYRDDERWVWVWMPVDEPDPERAVLTTNPDQYPVRNLSPEERAEYLQLRDEFYLVSPPQSDETVRFVESSEGLPQQGSWRNSLDVGDFNGDGHLDLIAPPQRGGLGSLYPTIFLGDGTGKWDVWNSVRWPQRSLNYGAARVADFNGDGHDDVAFALHLRGVAAFLGDGKGTFTDSSRGLPETGFPTRRIEIADVDADGDPDIIALTEGPLMERDKQHVEVPKMRIFRNHKKGDLWQEYQIGEDARQFGGDWLATGNFNGDQYPDIVTSSIYYHGTDVFWLSDGEMSWTAFGRGFIPWYGYVGDVDTANFTSGQYDDAVFSFNRYWPDTINPEEIEHPDMDRIAGIDVVSFSGLEPRKIPVIRWDSKRATWAMAAGDINGDGKADIVYSRTDPRENGILLGDGSGGFERAKIEGWESIVNTSYEITLADVDQDGRLDIIMMFEDSGRVISMKDGSIRVYLNRTEGR